MSLDFKLHILNHVGLFFFCKWELSFKSEQVNLVDRLDLSIPLYQKFLRGWSFLQDGFDAELLAVMQPIGGV